MHALFVYLFFGSFKKNHFFGSTKAFTANFNTLQKYRRGFL